MCRLFRRSNPFYATVKAVSTYYNNYEAPACVGYIIPLSYGVSSYVRSSTSTTVQMPEMASRENGYIFLL